MMTQSPDDVLDFWIGTTATSPEALDEKSKLWFQKSFETDRHIADTYVTVLADLAAGKAAGWAGRGPKARLAAIIVLDQFSRNIFRGHRFSFKHDALALRLAREGLARGEDHGMPETERVFFYLPFEHSEDIGDQHRSVDLFETLAREAREGFKAFCDMTLDYARQHLDVIERYGRFPHRNKLLRRASTREEEAYLRKPGAGF